MLYDGPLEPNTIIIGLPISVKSEFQNQFIATGLSSTDAGNEAIYFIRKIIEKYIPAGTPYIVIDENDDVWDGIPIGSK